MVAAGVLSAAVLAPPSVAATPYGVEPMSPLDASQLAAPVGTDGIDEPGGIDGSDGTDTTPGHDVVERAGLAVIGQRVIGRSVKGRPIRAFHLGDPDNAWTVVAIGAMHGDEQQTPRALEQLRDHQPISGVDLWVLPVLNPDGLRRGTRKNARGVDLNRNFPVRWNDLDGPYESGPRPASEPETRSTMRFLRRIDPDRMISLHQPFFNVDAKSSKNPRFSRRVAREMRIPIGNVDCGGVCHGTMTQWFNKRLAGASITVELAAAPSRDYLTRTAPNGLLRAVGGSR